MMTNRLKIWGQRDCQRAEKDIEQILFYQSLFYIPKVICSELINRYQNNPLVGHFSIKKTQELIAEKYYWLMLWQDVKAYVQGCNVCLASKAVCHKAYGNLWLLLVPTYWWKDLLMDFVTSLLISANWKDDSNNSILIIVRKMIYNEPVKLMIDAPNLAKVIINVIICYLGVLESIVTDWGSLFISKFWSLQCYFLGIKKKLFTAFYPQINGQIERKNSTIEAYLRMLINWEKDD